ncbi:MAG: A/G-specific adenine glycosylase [Immundisolibacteraceae bacterium]|nr:A/G-specific adenine glycosylase [Immundisolibacteraceae bacterium]
MLNWFDHAGRKDLPWQQYNNNPYPVWVSEIMLQQTQVTTVIPYYLQFMQRFPTVKSLAEASVDDVLARWSGLGYYARGRNLHKAAEVIVAEHQGQVPKTLEQLVALPGIGRSTAAAILALTWDRPETILDGNVKRVLARYHTIEGWTGSSQTLQKLWQLAEGHTPQSRNADYTQAIMDLGATVCRRSRPQCNLCPIEQTCQARITDRVGQYPAAKPHKIKPQRHTFMLLIANSEGELLLEKRPSTGIWGGLWSLPEVEKLPDQFGSEPVQIAGLAIRRTSTDLPTPIKHSFTHFDLKISPISCRLEPTGNQVMDNPDQLWYNPGRDTELGVSSAIKKVIHAYQTKLQE